MPSTCKDDQPNFAFGHSTAVRLHWAWHPQDRKHDGAQGKLLSGMDSILGGPRVLECFSGTLLVGVLRVGASVSGKGLAVLFSLWHLLATL